MFIFMAPNNLPTDTTILPNPEWEDKKSLQADMSLKKSMNNVTYTYIRRKNRYKFEYEFILTRMKALEFTAFVESYYKYQIKWTDHKNKTWVGYIVTDPIVFESIMIDEINKISIELEGVFIE